jgi:hypothetical protein
MQVPNCLDVPLTNNVPAALTRFNKSRRLRLRPHRLLAHRAFTCVRGERVQACLYPALLGRLRHWCIEINTLLYDLPPLAALTHREAVITRNLSLAAIWSTESVLWSNEAGGT